MRTTRRTLKKIAYYFRGPDVWNSCISNLNQEIPESICFYSSSSNFKVDSTLSFKIKNPDRQAFNFRSAFINKKTK